MAFAVKCLVRTETQRQLKVTKKSLDPSLEAEESVEVDTMALAQSACEHLMSGSICITPPSMRRVDN
ncbi:hypothetical protein NDU88_001894 [Pleurodeles waltl]|uniref:Uncharacterized protein n=1 Tax=Pleurodeles waltl TaxID=8319 RepID=A0AAV7Q8C6_PLEWA|nr:hypothetical protein NDU88_001894 [Pleurodeles waltl]